MSADLFEDEDKQKRAELRQKLRERELSDLAKVMSLPEGRRLLRRIIYELCRWMSSPFSQQDRITANLCGRREVGLQLLLELDKLPLETLFQMQREAANDQLLRALERKQIEGDDNE